MKNIRQIDFDTAFYSVKNGRTVYIIKETSTGATIKNLAKMTINDVTENAEDYIFIVIEE